jgi:hypothetical protein
MDVDLGAHVLDQVCDGGMNAGFAVHLFTRYLD